MDETLIVERIGWCRADAHHPYVGALWAADDRIRLVGRDAAFGIEVSLAIPVGEVGDVRIEMGRSEPALGEPCIVMTLPESAPILVWAIGAGRVPLGEIAGRITALQGKAIENPFVLARQQAPTGGCPDEGAGSHDQPGANGRHRHAAEGCRTSPGRARHLRLAGGRR